MRLKGVIFDLDDTLYPERRFVFSGLRAVARRLASPRKGRERTIYDHLLRLDKQSHKLVFDRFLAERPEFSAIAPPSLVEVYRRHRPKLRLFGGARALLRRLRRRGVKLGVISDGIETSQRAKVGALGARALVDRVVLTDAWGRAYWKPHPRAFKAFETAWGLPPSALAYVGNDEGKDFAAPNHLGWRTIRLEHPGQYRRPPALRAEFRAQELARGFPALSRLLLELSGHCEESRRS